MKSDYALLQIALCTPTEWGIDQKRVVILLKALVLIKAHLQRGFRQKKRCLDSSTNKKAMPLNSPKSTAAQPQKHGAKAP